MKTEKQGWLTQTISTVAGLFLVGIVGIDVYQAGGIETWSKWRVIGYGTLLFVGLWFCHPHSGRWVAQQVLERFGGSE